MMLWGRYAGSRSEGWVNEGDRKDLDEGAEGAEGKVKGEEDRGEERRREKWVLTFMAIKLSLLRAQLLQISRK